MPRTNSDNKTVGGKIVDRLQAFVEHAESGVDIGERFTCRTVKLNLEPQEYDAESVRAARAVLGASQAIFAQFIGVSVRTVQDWEQGVTPPSGSPCRIMDEIHSNPDYWRSRLSELATEVTA